MKLKAYISIILILTAILSAARPSRPGNVTFVQPDGTTFVGKCIGDEFMKVRMTLEGHSIIKDNDGWWCYAIYETDGSRHSSGCRVGEKAPADILARSMNIPYEVLSENAVARRSAFLNEEDNILKRTLRAQGAKLMAEGEAITKHGLVILAQYQDT